MGKITIVLFSILLCISLIHFVSSPRGGRGGGRGTGKGVGKGAGRGSVKSSEGNSEKVKAGGGILEKVKSSEGIVEKVKTAVNLASGFGSGKSKHHHGKSSAPSKCDTNFLKIILLTTAFKMCYVY